MEIIPRRAAWVWIYHRYTWCPDLTTTSEWLSSTSEQSNIIWRWWNKVGGRCMERRRKIRYLSGRHIDSVGPYFHSYPIVAFQVKISMVLLSLCHNCNPIEKLQACFEILQVPVTLQLELGISPWYSPPNHLLIRKCSKIPCHKDTLHQLFAKLEELRSLHIFCNGSCFRTYHEKVKSMRKNEHFLISSWLGGEYRLDLFIWTLGDITLSDTLIKNLIIGSHLCENRTDGKNQIKEK